MGTKLINRIVSLYLAIIILCTASSCNHKPKKDNDEFGYTFEPVIEYKGTEFRLDRMSIRERGYEVSALPLNFGDIEEKIRSRDNAMIVLATVVGNPMQMTEASATSISFSAEVICPVRIESILYKSEDNLSKVGDIVEVDLSGELCIIEGWMEYATEEENIPSGKFIEDECELYLSHSCGLAMISGAQYLLYLSGNADDCIRYVDVPNYRCEITNYCNTFEYNRDTRPLFQNDSWCEPFRFYNIIKEGGFYYDPSIYPETPSLSSEADIGTVGIRIGDTIVEGYEQLDCGYKCTGYSEKNDEYLYEYVNYETYDLSSGIIPDGCPTVICEYNETINVIFKGEAATWFSQGGRVLSAELYDIHGEKYATYNPERKQVYRSGHQAEAGIYFLKIDLIFFGPDIPPYDGLGEEAAEIGKEYIAQKSYLFAIVMN